MDYYNKILEYIIVGLNKTGIKNISEQQCEYIQKYIKICDEKYPNYFSNEENINNTIKSLYFTFQEGNKNISQIMNKTLIINDTDPLLDISLFKGANPNFKTTTVVLSSLYRNINNYFAPNKFALNFVKSQGDKNLVGFINNYQTLSKIISIELVSATVPNFHIDDPKMEKLYIKFDEFDGKTYNSCSSAMFAELTFDEQIVGSSFLKMDDKYHRVQKFRKNQELKSLGSLTVSVYSEYGDLFVQSRSDPIRVVNFTNTNPVTITTSTPHGFVNGDKIFIRNFTNTYYGTSESNIALGVARNNTINRYSGWVVTNVPVPTQLDIGSLSMADQSGLTQYDTELGIDPVLFPGGYNLGGKAVLLAANLQFTFVIKIISLENQ